MKLGGPALEYRRLRAPRADRAVVVEPAWADVEATLAGNQSLRESYHYDVSGRALRALGDEARRELLDAAYQYTAQYRDVPAPDYRQRVLLAGHQPELFHPGVWCKNFALGGMAAHHGATAVNLIVDSDTIKRTSLRVPGGTAGSPTVSSVRFDARGAQVPYEERGVEDWSAFESFGQRAAEQLGTLVDAPLLASFWPRVVGCVRRWGRLGQGFASARHLVEGDWGAQTLELPQSLVCGLPSFWWFAGHLLQDLSRLHEVYNSAAREYRRVNRIRSLNHPVPNLAADEGWLEAPFWVWTSAAPQRRRLFARRTADAIELTNRHGWQARLTAADDTQKLVEQLSQLAQQGIKLRSRALLTTLFARLVLGDLFLHGIGGAKYDELTDLIARRYFGIEPPKYMLLSATMLLPVERQRVTADDLRAVEQRLRELRFHPEQYLQLGALDDHERQRATQSTEEKRLWIATPQTRQNARQRCRAIRNVNEGLQPLLDGQREILLEQRARLAEALRGEAILDSREYSFCLYPQGALRDFMQQIGATAQSNS